IGALAGAIYGAGMSGREIRRFVVALTHNRGEVWRRAMPSRAGTVGDMLKGNFMAAVQLSAEKLAAGNSSALPQVSAPPGTGLDTAPAPSRSASVCSPEPASAQAWSSAPAVVSRPGWEPPPQGARCRPS